MAKKRVIVGMSGGVDSAVAAALLTQQGYEVIGVTLKLYSYEDPVEEVAAEKRECHPLAFIARAQEAAQALHISHHVIEREELFREKVIDPFLQDYRQGKTPLPCARCNRDVKTKALWDAMMAFNGDYIATGHYVRAVQTDQAVHIYRGIHSGRDQSFFLFMLPFEHIQRHLFPLGAYTKDQTRSFAREAGLGAADVKASQDLCFIAKKSYQEWISDDKVDAPAPGPIVHEDGRILGQHKGVSFYTVGQRQGLGIGGEEEPLYVVRIDAPNRTLTVGPRSALSCTSLHLEDVNWVAYDLQTLQEPSKEHDILVRIRSASPLQKAKVRLKQGARHAEVFLEKPEYGVAAGQACVFYDGDRLLGGGWITHQESCGGTKEIAA